jgi:predicted dehydrogenase
MPRHRLAIIGCGGMARAHVSRFEAVTDRLRVAAAVDIVPQRAKAVAEQFQGARWATDYREVLDDCDCVLIVLPHALHHPVGMDCLAAGKHVLMEKPMAVSERECLELIRAARRADKVLMTAYCMRFHPLVVKVKELIDTRAWGDVFHVSIWTEQHTQFPGEDWRHTIAGLGGGQLFSHGCHYIDLLLWFLGRPAEGTHVGTNYGTGWMEREGTSNVVIKFASGALGYHFGTWGAKGSRLQYSIHAHCTGGMIEAHLTDGKLYVHSKGDAELVMEGGLGKHTQREMAHFLDCVETHSPPLTDGPGSLQGLRVVWRLYEAEEAGRVADLRGLGFDQVDDEGNIKPCTPADKL